MLGGPRSRGMRGRQESQHHMNNMKFERGKAKIKAYVLYVKIKDINIPMIIFVFHGRNP